ncbi:acyl-CoA dehydrogenase [Cohnella yongneupensis]|uniref:Acyl-CoA dehydrogenase n=1 Tax=Cohnella yongneupensis TaxID=425006 RepID=A0ABW0QVE3_9BACL
MTVRFDDSFVSEARRRSASMEQARTIDPLLLDYIYENKLFKQFVPKSLGGLMLPLPEALRVFETAAWIDGSFGWLVTIGSGGGFFSATLPPRWASELFGHDKAVVAGSGHPNGIAKPVDGGYVVSGRWSTCSGSTFASVFTANCRIAGADGQSSAEDPIRSFAFMPDQVDIIRDWNAFGMRATDSHSIVVKDAFVPADRTFDILSTPRFDDPIFRYPFLPFAQTSFAAVSIGVGRHFLEEAAEFTERKAAEWSIAKPERLAAMRRRLEAQTSALAQATSRFYDIVDTTWPAFVQAGQLSASDEQEIGRLSQEAAKAALAAARDIFPLLGMAALMEDHPLNRTWRDLHTVTQHAVLVPLD